MTTEPGGHLTAKPPGRPLPQAQMRPASARQLNPAWTRGSGFARQIRSILGPQVPAPPRVHAPKILDAPNIPEVPKIPDVSNTPDVPNIPEAPNIPDTPNIPDAPNVPDTPKIPDGPSIPNVPNIPNRLLSWSGLPSDVLLEVASYLLDDRGALLNLTRICDYWRRVLIECPLNWTQISTKHPPKLLKLWLQRSKGLPIDGEICHLAPGLFPVLRSKATRFRSLRCTLNKKQFLRLFETLTTVSPNLERLELYRRHADQGSPMRFRFISGSMPSLTDLRLASIDITPEVRQLRHLINLELAHPFPSMTAILDLIASNPRLETITLSVKCAGKADPRPEGAVLIPRLRSLKFDFYSPGSLFRRLSVPRGATVSFSLWADPEECEVILPESPEHLYNLSEVKYLYVQRRSRYWIKASGPSGEVRFEGKNDPDPELRRLPLQSVEKFRYSELQASLETFSGDPFLGWIPDVFDRSQNLQTLVIDSCKLDTMKHIFCLLSPPNHASGVPSQCKGLPCPALSTIILEAPQDGSWDDWVVPFLQMLGDRAAAGSRLRKVRIVSSPRVQVPRPGEERRRQMARLVPQVEVKYFQYKDGTVDKRRAWELLEWHHDEEGFPGDSSQATHSRCAVPSLEMEVEK